MNEGRRYLSLGHKQPESVLNGSNTKTRSYMVSGFAGLEYKKVDVAAVKVAVLSIHRNNKEGISMVIKTLKMDDIHNMIAFIH